MLVNILFFNIVDVKNIWLIYKLCFFDYNTQKRTVKMRTTCHIAMVFDSEIVGYNYTEIRSDLLAKADPILKKPIKKCSESSPSASMNSFFITFILKSACALSL